jgi:hypothetical protein
VGKGGRVVSGAEAGREARAARGARAGEGGRVIRRTRAGKEAEAGKEAKAGRGAKAIRKARASEEAEAGKEAKAGGGERVIREARAGREAEASRGARAGRLAERAVYYRITKLVGFSLSARELTLRIARYIKRDIINIIYILSSIEETQI